MTLLVLIILLKKIQETFKIFLINMKENDLEDNYFLAIIFELIAPIKKPIFEIVLSCAPNVGLEPTTLRLRASCSTDWASRANSKIQLYPLEMY